MHDGLPLRVFLAFSRLFPNNTAIFAKRKENPPPPARRPALGRAKRRPKKNAGEQIKAKKRVNFRLEYRGRNQESERSGTIVVA
jgi:hypothetical protein